MEISSNGPNLLTVIQFGEVRILVVEFSSNSPNLLDV